ncbi:integrase catalytic domain-containing protein [Trichonephila clavipes]|nr:integrase catalytic domain-containing protein [Trichonephila clavipes]
MHPTKLEKCNLWFNGPDWLRSSTFPIIEFEDNPQLQEHMSAEAKRTSKLIMLNVVDVTLKAEFFQKFSSWNKLKRVAAYCLRFVNNCSLYACKRRKSFLTTAELSEAEKGIVKFIQRDHFLMEVSYLSAGKQLPSTNKLIPLTPLYDDSGIIRVRGRLKNSILADSQKHPILLPKTNHVVNLIISDYHLNLLHASPQLLQAAFREKFWILSARDAVRRVEKMYPMLQKSSKIRRTNHGRSSRIQSLPLFCIPTNWPLGVLSSNPDDPCVLTPGHFLIGKALTAIPQPTVPDNLRHCDRWRFLTRMTQHFWNRWSSEYLTLLQSRSKWRIVQKNLYIGDLVLIKHDNSPPLQWKLGKVTETFPGKDGKVRVVKPQRKKSRQKRSGERAGQFTRPCRPIHLPGYAVSNALRTSALKCAGAPSFWNHIRAFMLAEIPCSRTLHPYIQLSPCVLHFPCKSGILREGIAHVCYE